MAVIDIDEAKAMIWKQDVQFELDEVAKVLKNIEKELTTVAGSDDSIFQAIYKVGVAVEDSWNESIGNWQKCIEFWTEAIKKHAAAGQKVIEEAEALRGKAGGR